MPTARKPRRRPKTPPARSVSRLDGLVVGVTIYALVATAGWILTYRNLSGELARAEAAYLESVATVQAHWEAAYQRLLARLKESSAFQRPGEGGSSL